MYDYDIIVAGGGPGGVTAAIAAARNGAKTLLIEKNGFLGGMNTAAMVCPLMSFHAGDKQIVKGIAEEIIQRLIRRKGSLGHVRDPLGVTSTITPVEPEILKQVYFEMTSELDNLDLLLHTFICGTSQQNGTVKNITCVNKSGMSTYTAGVFIDATGDGDVAAASRVDFFSGRENDGLSQPMTLMLKLGGVDFAPIREYIKNNPEQFILDEKVDIDKYLAVSGFFDIVEQAKANGDFNIQRDRVLFFEGIHDGEIFVNLSRILKLSGTNAYDLTRAEIIGHRQVDEIILFFRKYIPGFKDSFLIATGSCIGVRESRRFKCQYTLTADDVMYGRTFDSSIAMCSFPIDIHDPMGSSLNWIHQNRSSCYDIPFEVMLPKKVNNLLVTGRCISATHEAMASSRITATVMALGQAAGTAAAIVCRDGGQFKDIIGKLQNRLDEQGAVVGKLWLK